MRGFTLVNSSSMNRPNKAGYTATPVKCEWAGAVFEVTRAFVKAQ